VDDKPSHTLLFAMLYEAQSLVAYNFSDKPRLHNYPRVWSVAQARSHGAAGRRGQLPSKFVLCRLPWSPPQKKTRLASGYMTVEGVQSIIIFIWTGLSGYCESYIPIQLRPKKLLSRSVGRIHPTDSERTPCHCIPKSQQQPVVLSSWPFVRSSA